MPGSSTYESRTPPPRPSGATDATSLVPGTATLRYPQTAQHESREEVVIDVAGPSPLQRTLVDVGVQPREGGLRRWETAYWQVTDGNRGTCATLLGVGNLRLRPGWYHLLVRPTVAGQQPVLRAGDLIVE